MCHWTVEQWAAIAAFGSAIAAFVQVFVAAYQSKIQRRQERLALFEKRYALLHRTQECFEKMCSIKNITKSTYYDLNTIIMESKFIFEKDFHKDISKYINNAVEISVEIGILARNCNENDYTIEKNKFITKINKISSELYKIFEPHLIISTKDF